MITKVVLDHPVRDRLSTVTTNPKKILILSLIELASASLAYAQGAESPTHGLGVGAALQTLGSLGAAGCLLSLLVCALFRSRFQRETLHRILFATFLLMPVVLVSTLGSVLEETKTVKSCASCHVMQSFVNDLTNPASDTLASAHYRNKWISENQCYTCHTSYGVHGTLDAKLGGLRHWWLYMTGTWKEPIRYRGKYPNSNCLACHADTPKYVAVSDHKEIAAALIRDEKSCASCHTPHPESKPAAPSPSPSASPGVKP